MSINATAVWECEHGGSANNGGAYDPSISGLSTDRSQSTTAYKNGTNLTVDHTTNTDVAPDGYTPDATADPGNFVHITAGAGFTAGWYCITSVVSGKWRLDRSPAAIDTASGTWYMGGALDSPVTATAAYVAGNKVFVKYNASYSELTLTTPWSLNPMAGTGALPIEVCSYDSTRTTLNADANRTLISTATNSTALLAGNATTFVYFYNFKFQNTAATRSVCMSNATAISQNNVFRNCLFQGFTYVFQGSTTAASTFNSTHYRSEFIGETGSVAQFYISYSTNWWFEGCYFHGTGAGIQVGNSNSSITCVHCVFAGLSGKAIDLSGISTATAGGLTLISNTFYNNTTANIDESGVSVGTGLNIIALDNIMYGGTKAWLMTAGKSWVTINLNNAYGNNSSTNWTAGKGDVTLSGDPFVAGGSGNFALNSTAGAGLACQGAGYPATLPGGTTTNYLDIGAFQHQAITSIQTSSIFSS